MPNIFRYSDYRLFLSDAFAQRKSEWKYFSHRYFAQKTGLALGYFTKVVKGQIELSRDKAEIFADVFGMHGPQRQALILMSQIASIKPCAERTEMEKELQDLRDQEALILADHQHAFYAEWYHTPIREIAALIDQPTPDKIAALLFPPVQVSDVERSLELLVELQLLQREQTPRGPIYTRQDKTLRSGAATAKKAITEYAANSIDHAKQALYQIPIKDRQIASLVVSVSSDSRQEILDLLTRTRREIAEIAARANNAHEVWHINFQAFPHAKWQENLS